MRSRERVVQSLEKVYRGAFSAAERAGDTEAMARLDLEYQRDQLHLEVLMDIRDLLTPEQPDTTSSLLEKAQQIRQLTKLRP
jgi:Spy/CpxP family protein refolding chaperone